MNPLLLKIQTVYLLLEGHFQVLYQACQTDAQRTQLQTLYVAARDAFWKAQNEQLIDDNATVQSISAELDQANNQIQQSLAGLHNIVAVLGLIANGVKLAAALATLAAAA